MKVAISLPNPIFDAAEQLAEQLHVSRSRLYAQAIEQYLARFRPASVTAKLNAVYGKEPSKVDSPISHAQSKVLTDEAW
jgi:metal-responsive CopG/Arc/MetJ family transcriptional regulator